MEVREAEAGQTTQGLVGCCEDFVVNLMREGVRAELFLMVVGQQWGKCPS